MMLHEFEERTNYQPDSDEYNLIELAYYISDENKDDFCKRWSKENANGTWDAKKPILAALDRVMRMNAEDERKMKRTIMELNTTINTLRYQLSVQEENWLQFAQ